METFETPAGKEIQVIRNPQAMWKIQFATGGELPEELTGIYTTDREAIKTVQVYLEKVKDRKPTKALTKTGE